VVQHRLASDAGASYSGYARDGGEFEIFAVPRPGVKMAVVERAIDSVLGRYAASPPAPGDIERAKTQLVADATYRQDSELELATAYGEALAVGLTADDVREWPGRIHAVTGEQLRRAAEKDLVPREAVTGYLLPPGQR
jgi:zinc protease